MASTGSDLKHKVDVKDSFEAHLFHPTDLKIIVGNFAFPVHKAVFIAKSGFFKSLCSSQFKEAQTNEVTLPEDDAADIGRLICWMYYGEYPCHRHAQNPGAHAMSFLSLNQILTAALCGESPEEIDGLFPLRDSNSWRRILSLHMYLLADKYDMPDLQNHCVNRIETFLIKEGNTEWFWQSLDFIKETTVDTKLLKECLSSHLAHHLSRYVDDERFGQLIKDLPEVTWLAFKNVIDVIRMKDVLLGL